MERMKGGLFWKPGALMMIAFALGLPLTNGQQVSDLSTVAPPRRSHTKKSNPSQAARPVISSAVVSPQSFNVTGTWIDSFGYPWTLSQDQSGSISGSVNYTSAQCPIPIWPVAGSVTGDSQFSITATNPDGGDDICVSYVTYDMTINSEGNFASGTWMDPDGNGKVTMKLSDVQIQSIDLVNNVLSVILQGTSSESGTLDVVAHGMNSGNHTVSADNGQSLKSGQHQVPFDRTKLPPDLYDMVTATWNVEGGVTSPPFSVSPEWNVRGIVENTVYIKVYEDACSGSPSSGYWTFDRTSCAFSAVDLKPQFASQTFLNGTGETSAGELVHANTQSLCKKHYPKGATKTNTFFTISDVTGSCHNSMEDGDVAVYPNPVLTGGPYSCNDQLLYVAIKTGKNAYYPQTVEDYCPVCSMHKTGTYDHVDNYFDNNSCTANSLPNYWETDLGQGGEKIRIPADFDSADQSRTHDSVLYQDNEVRAQSGRIGKNVIISLDAKSFHKDVKLPLDVDRVIAIRRYSDRLIVIASVSDLVSRVLIIDLGQGQITDSFEGFNPTVSPNGRFIAFIKFYPPHFVRGADDHYMLYDVEKTAIENRPAAVPLDDLIDVGMNVYPGGGNKEDDNLGVLSRREHHAMSSFSWSADSGKLVFADQAESLTVVLVKVLGSATGTVPTALLSPMEGTTVCAAPLASYGHCDAYLNSVEFHENGIKSYFNGTGTKGSIHREFFIGNKEFVAPRP
jgi:hypothetical protein